MLPSLGRCGSSDGHDNNGTPNAPRVTLTYGYDQIGNRTLIQDNFGGITNLTYDSDNNLTKEVMAPALNQPTVTLVYDSANRLTSLSRTVVNKFGNSNTVTSTMAYDNADRLIGITDYIVGGSTLMTLTYGYDQANQLTSYVGPDGSITYGYDNDGQLTGATGAHNETYTYDKEGNRTLTGYVTSIGNRLTSDGTYSYTYDQDGNMLTQTRISDSQLTSYTWDFRNRLTEVLIKTSGGTTVQDDKFTYDVENRRIGKNTLSGGQSWTAYVDANPYADFNSSGSLTFWHLYGVAIDSLLGRVDSSGNAMWYMMDKLGSVRENVDANGNVLDSITYDTYGNIIAETHPTSGDRFKYTSREWDSEIGQYFYRARYYSPTDGRFESEDPSGFAAGDTDFYRYVRNDSTGLKDPTGLWSAPYLVTMTDAGKVAPKWFPAAMTAKNRWQGVVGDFVWAEMYKVSMTDVNGNPVNPIASERVTIASKSGFFKAYDIDTTEELVRFIEDYNGLQTRGGMDTPDGRATSAGLLQADIINAGGNGEEVQLQYFIDGPGKVIKNSGFRITLRVEAKKQSNGAYRCFLYVKKEGYGWSKNGYPDLNWKGGFSSLGPGNVNPNGKEYTIEIK